MFGNRIYRPHESKSDTRVYIFSQPQRLFICALLFLALAMSLSACDSGDVTPNSSTPTPPTTVQATQMTKPTIGIPPTQPSPMQTESVSSSNQQPTSTVAKGLDINQAWGANLPIALIPALVDATHQFLLMTITPDARYLVGSVVTRKQDELGGTEPGKVVLMDVQTHKITELRMFPHNDTQMVAAAADDEWVVWAESAQEPNFFANWVIYSYNRKSQLIKQIAEAPRDKNGVALAGGPLILPKVDHGIAVWSQIPPEGADKIHSLVMSTNLATGETSTITDLGLQPTISWPYVAWEGPTNTITQSTAERPDTNIYVLDLQTGVTQPVKSTRNPSGFSLYKDSVVWITAQGDQINLTDVNDSKSQVIAQVHTTEADVAEGDTLQFPTINDRLITWISYRRIAVWDRARQQIVNVTPVDNQQRNSFVNGNGYVWQSGASPEDVTNNGGDLGAAGVIYNIVDTSQLSVH